jgi:hypothetical protein
MLNIMRRMRTLLPTCLSIGFGDLVDMARTPIRVATCAVRSGATRADFTNQYINF